MKHLFKGIIALSLGLILLTSCNKEESTLKDLRTLSEYITTNSDKMTTDDWNKAIEKHNEIVERIKECNLTQEQMLEVTKLEATISTAAYKAAAKSVDTATEASETIKAAIDEAKEGVNEAVDALKDAKGEVKEGINEALDAVKDAVNSIK